MKRIIFLFSLLLIALFANAQISKLTSDSLVLNMFGSNYSGIVYGLDESINDNNIITADGDEIINPYNLSYIYFIDESPAANWSHSCKYCFVNVTTGNHTIFNNNMYPENYSDYEVIYMPNKTESMSWSGITRSIPNQVSPNDHQWAVLICSYADQNVERFWGDLSCVYTTLKSRYGFIENENPNNQSYFNHIIVFAPQNVIGNKPLDLNNSGGCSNNDFITEHLLYADNKVICYDKESIQIVFDNLSGRSNSLNNYGYRALDSLDKLFVYVTGHGHTTGSNSYINLEENETLYDYELSDMVKNIDCSQMTFLLQSCYSGGFVDDLSNITNVKCKNRVVQSATSDNRYSHTESYINLSYSPSWQTRSNNDDYRVCEFTYYWCSALLGYYPIIRLNQTPIVGPWDVFENNMIGSFPWNMFFNETVSLNHGEYDVSPDTDCDGIVSLEEAFQFARKLDSWDTLGYYNPPYALEQNGWVAAEYPQSSYESTFTKELITLDGYRGVINNDVQTGTGNRYILDGNVMIGNNASLTINSGCVINGNNHEIVSRGSVSTALNSNNITIKKANMINAGGAMSLSHCVFDTCGMIESYNGPFSLKLSTLNQTCVEAYREGTPRDQFDVTIKWNTFNNTLSDNTISLIKLPQCEVGYNTITSGGNGIFVKGLEGLYQNYLFSNNTINNCVGSGFVSYYSNGKLKNNYINSNGIDGIQSLNTSNLYVRGDSAVTFLNETQRISGNGRYQVYATINSYPQDFHYNGLCGNGTDTDFILYFESQGSQGTPMTFNVTKNCWDPLSDSNVPSHLITNGNATFVYTPTWTPSGSSVVPGGGEPGRMLSNGNDLAGSGDYDGAKEVFMKLVEDYPDSQEAISALKTLLSVEIASDGDFANLKNYYLDLANDEFLGATADNLSNRCDVDKGNFNDAIIWYEDKLVNPNSSYTERIFAEIDLGDLYLEMNNNGIRGISGKMLEYIPVSTEAHKKRSNFLLSSLPGNQDKDNIIVESKPDNKNILIANLTCHPNPANKDMTLSYLLEKDANVELIITDMLGNKIRHIHCSKQSIGNHDEIIDISNLSEGTYLCGIITEDGVREMTRIVIAH